VDLERIAELRAWAGRLEARTDHEELRAAGKAISLLVDEVEDLQARLVTAEAGAPPPARAEPGPADEPAPIVEAPIGQPTGSLRDRLKRTLGFQ